MKFVMRDPAAWFIAALLLAAVLIVPFTLVDVPAVVDYPNHLARFYILAHPDDPALSRMYAAHWAILPNIGLDPLGVGLLRLLPAHVGGRIVLAISLFAPLAGVGLYARAAFGRWTWWSLGSGVLAYNGIFVLGFMNFLVSLGVALAGAAAWRLMRRRGLGLGAAAVGAAIGVAAFFCHLFGFLFFALLIGAQEADEWLAARKTGDTGPRDLARTALILALALGPAALLYLATHRSIARGDAVIWHWRAKLLAWLSPFMTYDFAWTLATALAVIGLTALVWRKARRASGASLAIVALMGLYAVCPFAVAGGALVDTRLTYMAALVLFAGVAPQVAPRTGLLIAVVLAIFTLGRTAAVAQNWRGHALDLADLRAELAYVPAGAKILPAHIEFPETLVGDRGRTIPDFAETDYHLPALAVIERQAFWPLQFADPNQQPMVVRPPYDQIAMPLGWPAPWTYLFDDPATRREYGAYTYLRDWRRRFDFVLLIGPAPNAGRPPPGLTLVRGGPAVSLYRITRP